MPVAVQNAVAINLLDAVAIGVQNGSSFALPVKPGSLSWQTVYGTAPGSITVNLQGSNDGVNFFTLDTSTNVNGEVRIISSMSTLFIRATISASAGGTTVTVILVYKGTPSLPITGVQGFQELFTSVKQQGNVDAGLTDLLVFDLPANTLVSNGDALVIEMLTQSANNATNKLTAIVSASTTIASESGVPTQNLPRLHRVRLVRTGPTTAQAYGCVDTQGGATLVNIGTPLTDDWRTVIRFRGIAQGGADNDVIHRLSQMFYYPVGGTFVGL